MASRRESRSAASGLHTLEEFDNLRRTFKASNDRLAKKNNELLAQITTLNKQLQESAQENFQLRGELSMLKRNSMMAQARAVAFERERQTMVDLLDEVNRASEWTRKNVASLRRSFDAVNSPVIEEPTQAETKALRRQSLPSIIGVSKPPDMSQILEGGSDIFDSPHRPHSIAAPSSSRRSPSPTPTYPSKPVSTKARDSLSLTWSNVNVASSSSSTTPASTSTSHKNSRRFSGLMPTPVPGTSSRSSPSPPPESSRSNGFDTKPSTSRPRAKTLDQFDPNLSPATVDSAPSNVSSRPKDVAKVKKRAPIAEPEIIDLDADSPDKRLNDVTNGVGAVSSRKEGKVASTSSIRNKGSEVNPPSSSSKPPPTPVVERKPKKSSTSTSNPTLSEDMMKNVDMTARSKGMSTPRPTSASGITERSRVNRVVSPTDAASKSEPERAAAEDGRERRVRKSVNYAEPKLNTKMRKPEGWEEMQKSRWSLAPHAGSSSPPPPDTEAAPTSKKRRATVSSSSGQQRSSSPLGDVDEPKTTVTSVRATGQSHARRRSSTPYDDDEDGDDEATQRMHVSETSRVKTALSTSAIPTKAPKSSRASSSSEYYASATSSSSAHAHTSNFAERDDALTRKRKAPSYSASSPPPIDALTDDEEETDGEDDDEYIEDYPRSSTSTSKVSVRRPSSATMRRSLLNGKSSTAG